MLTQEQVDFHESLNLYIIFRKLLLLNKEKIIEHIWQFYHALDHIGNTI